MINKRIAAPPVKEMDAIVGIFSPNAYKNKDFYIDNLSDLKEPTKRDILRLEDYELDLEDGFSPSEAALLTGRALTAMCTELVTEPAHHIGADRPDTRTLGMFVWEA